MLPYPCRAVYNTPIALKFVISFESHPTLPDSGADEGTEVECAGQLNIANQGLK